MGIQPKKTENGHDTDGGCQKARGDEKGCAKVAKPSWYAVSKNDYTINPDLERFLAKRMNATTIELDAGHLSLVSHPKEVANLILEAAGSARS